MSKVTITIEDDNGQVTTHVGRAVLAVLDLGEDYQTMVAGPGEGLPGEEVGAMLMCALDSAEDNLSGIMDAVYKSVKMLRAEKEEEEDDPQIIDLSEFLGKNGRLS
jgi:hypothetical protein